MGLIGEYRLEGALGGDCRVVMGASGRVYGFTKVRRKAPAFRDGDIRRVAEGLDAPKAAIILTSYRNL